jgi:DNA helicase-2/ATP-dependent DNA helicase PcrA
MEDTGADDDPRCSNRRELMVVGDADQSIYAFRGATIRNILDFEQDYPHAATICWSRTTARPRTILTAANAVIPQRIAQTQAPVDRSGPRGGGGRLCRRRRL